MTYKFSNNIRVFYGVESPVNTPGKNDSGKLDIVALISKTSDLISKSEKSQNPNVKLAYNLLVATGAISTNYLALASRWYEGSGRSGAEAIIKALESAEKGGAMEIVLYSKGSYSSIPLKTYESQVSANVGMLNGGAITKGLFDLYKAGSSNSFSESTWAKIGIYLKSRGIDGNKAEGSKIITDLPPVDIKSIISLGDKQITAEKTKIEAIINPIIAQFGKDNPKLLEIFEKNKNITFKNGVIDLTPLLQKAKERGENITDIIKIFEDATKTVEQESKVFEEISQKSLQKVKGRSFKEIIFGIFKRKKKDKDGKESVVDTKPNSVNIQGIAHDKSIETLNINEINTVLPSIQKAKMAITSDGSNPDKEIHLQTLNEIEKGLTARIKKQESDGKAAQLKSVTKELQAAQRSGKTIDTVIQESPKIIKKLESVNAIAIDRSQLNDSSKRLEAYGITTLEKAQEKLKELGNPKNEEEIKLKADIIGYIQGNKDLAQKYIIAKQELGEDIAQEIFTDTNRYIGKNSQENYNFQALEQIAIITDPESTSGQRALAQLEPGKSISIQRAIEGEMQNSILYAPEISGMSISKNQNGTFDVPVLNQKGLSKPQLEECITNIVLYADLGLSQFIPHIPMITQELNKKGINTAIDGNSGTMEQQQVLKEIYRLLFGKTVETNNLGDVQRAFSSSLGNPTNMRSAMQHSLKIHKLIGESGQSISSERFQKWIRGGTDGPDEVNKNSILDL